jgi:hypothetical protein
MKVHRFAPRPAQVIGPATQQLTAKKEALAEASFPPRATKYP